MRSLSIATVAAASCALALAATQSARQFTYEVHDPDRPQPPKVEPGPMGAPAPAPSDAVVLFGAARPDLSAWRSGEADARWTVRDGAMIVEPKSGDVSTREKFGDVQLHIEWLVPADAKVEGQMGGNSGIFLLDRYELQILASNPNVTYADGMAGAIYGQYPPLANACRPQGQWNVYDVVFRAPVFDGARLVRPATMTAFLNGVLVQDNAELLGSTAHKARAAYEPHDDTGPIRLQDHGDPIRFRNIWVRRLPARTGPE